MMLSQPSVNDLNSRLKKEVSPLNFRPNIIIDGCQAYDEVTHLVYMEVTEMTEAQFWAQKLSSLQFQNSVYRWIEVFNFSSYKQTN